MKFEIYTTDENYYQHKDKLKSVFDSFRLKWNGNKSGWFCRANSVIKRSLNNNDRLLIVSGSSDFTDVIESLSNIFFTEIRNDKQEESLEDFILRRVEQEKQWAKELGYNVAIVEYFTMRRIVDSNS